MENHIAPHHNHKKETYQRVLPLMEDLDFLDKFSNVWLRVTSRTKDQEF